MWCSFVSYASGHPWALGRFSFYFPRAQPTLHSGVATQRARQEGRQRSPLDPPTFLFGKFKILHFPFSKYHNLYA